GNGLEASSTPQPDAPPDIQADDGAGNGLVRQLTRVVRDLVRTEQHLRQVAQYNHLARVAQYRQLIPEDDRDDPLSPSSIRSLANEHYLKFLKWFLLQIARRDPAIPDSVSEELVLLLREGFSFSDLAQELGYPRFNEKYPDILRQLAKLPLPIYITTGYYDFLERLLQVEDKHPITQICFHRGEPSNVLPEHRTIHHYEPSINKPVVYHLYGFERYPASLVISESDYMDFLLTMAQDTDTQKPVIPLYIRDALADSDLLLLGYRLPDWDFRVLFRSLLKQDDSSTNRKFSVALQLDPGDQENIQDTARARRYLRRYFKSVNFSVVLSSTVDFVQKLCEEWDR
ncbi:MAG: SIR2 family protein, partial [Candidatus Thorarchaeota archaeon]